MSDILKGWMIGEMLTRQPPDTSAVDAANRRASSAEGDASYATMEKYIQQDRAEVAEKQRDTAERLASLWSIRANNIHVKLNVAKIIQDCLLDELAKADPRNKFLKDGILADFEKVQIETGIEAMSADPSAYSDVIAEAMPANDAELRKIEVEARARRIAWEKKEREEAQSQAQAEARAAELSRLAAAKMQKRESYLASIESPYLDKLPRDVQAMNVDQRMAAINSAKEQLNLGFATSLPAWISVEEARRQTMKQVVSEYDAKVAMEEEAARAAAAAEESARIEAQAAAIEAQAAETEAARLAAKEANFSPLQKHLNSVNQSFLDQLPEDIRALMDDQRTAAMTRAREQLSLGFAISLPAWVSVEMARRDALIRAEREFKAGIV